MKSTFNITVKCETEEERDLLLEVICEYPELARCYPKSNVFFSENEGTHWADEERQVI